MEREMKLLIPTEPDDTHAIIVKLAMENIGQHVRLLFTADQPTKQKSSVFIDGPNYQWKSSDNYDSVMDNDYDIVWWRRARRPFLPKHLLHAEDYPFVFRENILFHESLTNNMAPDAWWINDKVSAHRANTKLLQLKIANDCDLTTPLTLCSNDPDDIRHFLLRNKDGVIYKPLCSNFWFEDEQIKIAYTSKINILDLPSDQSLQLTPGIYQKEMRKKYELRITCFGEYLVAAKLNSQVHNEGITDWRAIPNGKMQIEPYPLPFKLEQQIRMFMQKMGLVFGSLDFIVTPENDYIFLEVNEQGQFLWIEEYNSEFKMLDMFIQFLLQKTHQFQWDPQNCAHTIDQYRDKMMSLQATYMSRHVELNSAKAYQA